MIVVFGSLNVDLIVPVERLPHAGETVLGPSYTFAAGGKGANQALAAARAGARTFMIGKVGGDDLSAIALNDLKAAGVDLSCVGRDEKPTGLAAICVDSRGENIIMVASGANLGAQEAQVPDAVLNKDTVVVLQMETPLEENWKLVRRAKSRGARVMLNVAPAAAVPSEIIPMLDWLVVNEREALLVAESRGFRDSDPRKAAAEIAATGKTTVIVTLGGDGAVAYGAGKTLTAGVLAITPIDTVAAGDAFVGGFAASVDRGGDLAAALAYGSVAGGLACLATGAQPALPMKIAIDAALKNLPPIQAG